jgi:hypothetical protein
LNRSDLVECFKRNIQVGAGLKMFERFSETSHILFESIVVLDCSFSIYNEQTNELGMTRMFLFLGFILSVELECSRTN